MMAYDIECPHCNRYIENTIFEEHFNECEPRKCLYGCGKELPAKKLKVHHQDCPHNPQNFIAENAFPRQAEDHAEDLSDDEEILDDCPWYCGRQFSVREMADHTAICDNAEDDCLYKCGLSMTRAELRIHQQTCPGRLQAAGVLNDPVMNVPQEMCLKCSKILPESQIVEHQRSCFANTKFVDIMPNAEITSGLKAISRGDYGNPMVDGIIYDDYHPSSDDDSDEEVNEIRHQKNKPTKQKDIFQNTYHAPLKHDSDDDDIFTWKPYSSKKKNDTHHTSMNDNSDEENIPHGKSGNSKRKDMFRNPDHEDMGHQKPEASKQKTSNSNENSKKNYNNSDFDNKKHDPTIDLEASLFESITNRSQQKTSFVNKENKNDDEISSDEDATQTLEDFWAEAKVYLQQRLDYLEAQKKNKMKSSSINRGSFN